MAVKAKPRPLFTEKELQSQRQALAALDAAHKRDKTPWEQYWSEREALEQAQITEMVQRAQGRAEEYLNALLVLVGKRGAEYVPFESAFALSRDAKMQRMVKEADTAENRRVLYTVLRALTEIPKSWASSAFVRFLRGMGKQRGAKYHGAGSLGVRYGWTEREVQGIVRTVADGRNPYSQVLMSYADVEEEADTESEVEYDEPAPFGATRVERDTVFLNRLCDMLEARGLSQVPVPAAEKPKKERKPKVFKPGDVIRKSNIRDLPLPAHVRIPCEKEDAASKQWLTGEVEQVVLRVASPYCTVYGIGPDGTACPSNLSRTDYKPALFGATYLGPWKGKVDHKRRLRYNFNIRKPGELDW